MSATGTLAKIEEALFARCADMALYGPTLPVAFQQDASFTVPSDGKYLEVTHLPNKPFCEALSDGAILQGILQVTLHWPNGVGTIAAQNARDDVVDYFAKGTTLFGTGVKAMVVGTPWSITLTINAQDMTIPITISYRAFLTA